MSSEDQVTLAYSVAEQMNIVEEVFHEWKQWTNYMGQGGYEDIFLSWKHDRIRLIISGRRYKEILQAAEL